MAIRLWTVDFMRISIANLLLFVSLYVLFPVLSLGMAERLGIPVAQTGIVFLCFILGIFLIGPFHAYLIDAYKRKYVCMFSFVTLIAATAGYAFATNQTEFMLLSIVQGMAFGMATTAGITLAIDITSSTLRSPANISFLWIARLGMILGVALGVWLYHSYGFKSLLYVSVLTGALGALMLFGVYVPFRAPIVTKLYSFDRFFLPRAWIPALNIILITFVPGLLISLVHPFLNDTVLENTGIPVPFFAGTGVGYLLSVVLSRLLRLSDKTLRLGVIGIALEILAMSLLLSDTSIFTSAIILGVGLGFVIPEFLIIFVKLSQHCQRVTGNTTHLLACEVGFVLGMVVACHLDTKSMIHTGQIIASLALLFFLLITYPYYRKMTAR